MANIDTKTFEGLRLHVYKDSVGKSTIGYGHNLQGGLDRNLAIIGLSKSALLSGARDLTLDEANQLFNLDMNDARAVAKDLVPNYDELPIEAQSVLDDLSFNMGSYTLSQFHNTLSAFKRQDFKAAASGLQRSKWFTQVGNRGRIIVRTLQDLAG